MFMSRGLAFLCSFLVAISGYEQYQIFQSIMHDLVSCSVDRDFITYALVQVPTCMQEAGDSMEAFCHNDEQGFEGDDDIFAPPFAWVWANAGKYQPFYGQSRMWYLRSLGYVMWDQKRLLQSPLFQREPLQPREYCDHYAFRREATIERHRANCSRKHVEAEDGLANDPSSASHPAQDQEDPNTSENTTELSTPGSEHDVSILSAVNEVLTESEQTNESMEAETDSMAPTVRRETGEPTSDSGPRECTPEVAISEEIIVQAPAEEDPSPDTSTDGFAPESTVFEQTIFRPSTPRNVSLPNNCEPASPSGSESSISRSTSERSTSSSSSDSSSISSRSSSSSSLENAREQSGFAVEQSAIKELADPLAETKENDSKSPEDTKSAFEADLIPKAHVTRKMARAVSPRARLLELQQHAVEKDEICASGSINIERTVTIQSTSPASTVVQPPAAPSPPTFDHGSISFDFGYSIKPEESTTIVDESSTTSVKLAECVTTPPHHSANESSRPQLGNAKHPAASFEQDKGNEKIADQDTNSSRDSSQIYHTKTPENLAAWIEGCNPRQAPPPRSGSPPSSNSDRSSNSDSSLTKQQRKKANRKARKAALDTAILHAEEKEAARLKREEAKKEHQKMKKERKKTEKEKEAGGRNADGKSQIAAKSGQFTKQARKLGYMFG
jgi:hypothetical protein